MEPAQTRVLRPTPSRSTRLGPSRPAVAGGAGGRQAPLSSATWRPLAGGRPSFPAEGRRVSRALRALPPNSRLPSCPGRGGAGRGPRPCRVRAALAGALSVRARCADFAEPPLPRELVSAAAEAATAAEIGIRLPAPRRKRAEGRGRGTKAPAPVRRGRARRGPHGRARGDRARAACTPRAEAEPGPVRAARSAPRAG